MALRFHQETRQAAQIFSRPPPPRPTKLLGELCKLKAQLDDGQEAALRPPEYLWPHLLVSEPHEIDALMLDKEALSTAVRNGIAALESSSELEHSRKGGQYRDPRLDTFVMYLARIFHRYAKSESKFTIAPDTGEPSDAFSRYMDEAIHQFHPAGLFSPGSLRNALQRNRQFLRDTEPLVGDELDQIVPKDPLIIKD
jgi:hypothetical protein